MSDFKRIDITKEVQMILSTIYRTNQMYGKNYIIDILRGSQDKKILQNAHDKLSVYNIGKHYSKKAWFILIDRVMELELLTHNEHKGLILTPDASDVLKSKRSINIRQERLEFKEKKATVIHDDEMDYNQRLFDKLRLIRAQIANNEQIPAYLVFNDKTLKEMSSRVPQTKKEFLAINGVGERKYEKYAKTFLEELRCQ